MRGCDYSWDRPDLSCLKSNGVGFIVRYGSRDPSKNLSRSELDSALSKGIAVAVVWEEGGTMMQRGYAGGQTDARDMLAFTDGLGLGGIPHYYACDWDAQSFEQGVINAYLDGVASVIGRARTGMYAGINPLRRALDAGKITWAWQTYAWSGGAWDNRAHLRQVQNNVSVCGGLIDWDESMTADFGQWPRPRRPVPTADEEEDMAVIPSGPGAPALDISFTGRGEFAGVNLGCDVGTYSPQHVTFRVARHIAGTGSWRVSTVTLVPDNPRQVVSIERDIDIISIRWMSGAEAQVVPALKRTGT